MFGCVYYYCAYLCGKFHETKKKYDYDLHTYERF